MFDKDEVISYSNQKAVDEGLRSFMLKIYNYMAGGLVLTALSAWSVSHNIAILKLFFTPNGYSTFGWLVLFAPFIMCLFSGWIYNKNPQTWFWFFSTIMGFSLAPLFLFYTGTSIARVFLITSAAFGALSIYGYTTKKDMTAWGSFLIMGVIGLIIASIVNIFLKSTGLDYALSYLTVFIFAGLTAYDTQKMRSFYFLGMRNEDVATRGAIAGALSLYLDFVNMFLALLRIMGNRR